MAELPILTWPDTRLASCCMPVEFACRGLGSDLLSLVQDMFDTMYAAPGRGLAAPQVGVLKRLFVMDCGWKGAAGHTDDEGATPMVMINPKIQWVCKETVPYHEGCLSIPGVLTEVYRPEEIRVRWQDQDGIEREGAFSGFEARCIQHEMDHLEGRITFDHLLPEARIDAEAQYRAAREDTR